MNPSTPTAMAAANSAPDSAGRSERALLGFGQVWHKRLRPAGHEFRHDSYFLMLPLRSLRREPEPWLRRNRWGLLSFHDRDHGEGGSDALAWFEQLLAREDIHDADGEIWLQTYPRILGHTFKPVSFWWAMRADGSPAALLAEVNNTFGDRHCYLLSGPELRLGAELSAAKLLHVSPFCALEGRYRFRFHLRRDDAGSPRHALVRVDHDDAQGALLQTSLGGTLQALKASSVLRAFFGMPLLTLGVVLRIHWHALRLWLKRVPFHRRPAAPENFLSR